MLDLDLVEVEVTRHLLLFSQLDVRRPLPEDRWRANGGRSAADLIVQYGPPGPSMPVQLCCGMGVDSAVIITELIENPDARLLVVADEDGRERLVRVDLADITVVTAMTGDEYDETRAAMEDHLLPLMRAAGLRYTQISRAAQSQEAGIVVLDDSRAPEKMFMRGPWALQDELSTVGTVPQTAAHARRCSARAKGWPLDVWAADEYGDTERIHILGFAAEEDDRVTKDQSYSQVTRRSVYPLRLWGFDRAYCLDYLWERFGIIWPRSCCSYCPFAGGSKAKNSVIADRWRREPDAGVLAIWLETLALALNPRMALFKDITARRVAVMHGLDEVLALVEEHLDASVWAIYDVKRVIRPYGARKPERLTKAKAKALSQERGVTVEPGTFIKHPGDPSRKGRAARSTTVIRTGSRAEMTTLLEHAGGGAYERDVTPRRHLMTRQNTYPTCERFLVAAPVAVMDKQDSDFSALWESTLAVQGSPGRLTKKEIRS